MQTALILQLPCELHEKIVGYISNAEDVIAFSNVSRVLRERLQSSNYVWYNVLKNAGSVKDEYERYDPKRDYLARALCELSTLIGYFMGFTANVAWICASTIYDNFWDGFVNPPQFEVPEFLIAKGYSEAAKRQGVYLSSFGRPSSCRQPMQYVLKSDTSKLLRALMESDEAVEECINQLKLRNEAVEKAGRQDSQTLIQNVLEMMVEDYEDHHNQLHLEQSPEEFREYWSGNIVRLLEPPAPGSESRAATLMGTQLQNRSPNGLSKGAQLFYRLAMPLIVPGKTPEM
ncbi:hypothetical protein ABW21_db0202717 [Orbilia brochopaga]|nr:hypothetical protein ABW21_db0202717 [Drechslerella brochopaga]